MKPLLIILFALYLTPSKAQYSRHIIRLKDKQGTSSQFSSPAGFLSPKSIERRTRQNLGLDSTDLPVNSKYIDSIRNVPGVEILNISKWLNQVLIRASDPNAIQVIESYSFVNTISAVAPVALPSGEALINSKFNEPTFPLQNPVPLFGAGSTEEIHNEISYGNSLNQVHIHEGEYLHNLGHRGKAMVIAVLDAGFSNVPTNPAFDSARLQGRILGGYDFVSNTTGISLANNHGMSCLSTMAANLPGQMVGTAPGASFWLLRTEDAASEYIVEEHNWAVAAEFADSVGVDLISSSLGYTSFTDPAENHSYQDRDGNTCISTIAADLAAKKGIIVMNSAGNNGGQASDEKYVSCPADGDSVVAVGAIRADRMIAAFSSWGPNGAGKVKPDFVSIGQGTVIAGSNGSPIAANGTSFANPNLAGLIACLWEAFPEFGNMEIIEAVRRSADRYSVPDIRYGYGIPNFRLAYQYLADEKIKRSSATILADEWIKSYPVPFDSKINIIIRAGSSGNAQVRLIDMLGRTIRIKSMNVAGNQISFLSFDGLQSLAPGMYLIQYIDANNRKTIKTIKK